MLLIGSIMHWFALNYSTQGEPHVFQLFLTYKKKSNTWKFLTAIRMKMTLKVTLLPSTHARSHAVLVVFGVLTHDVINWLPSRGSGRRSAALYAVIALYNAA